MSKIELKIVGDDTEEIRETLAAVSAAFTGGGAELSVADLTARLKAALPSMDITMTPKAKGGAEPSAEGEKAKRGRPKKEDKAEPEADPFASGEEDKKPAEPEQTPAEMRAAAVDMLMKAYNDKAKQAKVLDLLKKFGVKKFAEVGDDKAGELLAAAQAI